jgi:hypothetical protein
MVTAMYKPMLAYFTDDDRMNLPAIERQRYKDNRARGIHDRAQSLERTTIGVYGEFACKRLLGGTLVREGGPVPGVDLIRIEGGRRVTYEIKTTSARHHEWGLLPGQEMIADRGILVTPAWDDVTLAAEIRGWFDRSAWVQGKYQKNKGGRANSSSWWLPNTALIHPVVLLIEPVDGGKYAAINEEYQARANRLRIDR